MKSKIINTIENIERDSQKIGFNQISDKLIGQFLATLCSSKIGGKFLELGTGSGLSTTWIAEGMDNDSILTTVDNDERLVNIAKQYLGQDSRITFVVAQGEDVIESIEVNSLDFIFADTWPGKYNHLEETLALLKIGGMYVIDDMLAQDNWPEGHNKKAEKLIAYLHKRADFEVTEMAWSTGVIVCTKRAIKTEETNDWNANRYTKHADFVSALGMPVVDLLAPQKGEKILDLGCGDGTLALELEKFGAEVVAVDLSQEMVTKSREKGLDAHVMSVTELIYHEEFDAVFSNAVLHWVRDSRLAVENIHTSLKCGGRFVAEFGGHGNVYHIVSAMREVFGRHKEYGEFDDFWLFPTVAEYQEILEECGFEVEYIELIPRPTPIDDIANWLDIFANGIASNLTDEQKVEFKKETREILKSKIYTEESGWVADYVRLRVRAVKV